MIKKILVNALAVGVMTTVASADGFIKLGAGQVEADTTSKPTTTKYNVGFGGNTHFAENFLIGGELSVGKGEFDFDSGTTNEFLSFGADLHLGYTFFDDLDIFAIAGYEMITMDYKFASGGSETLKGSGFKYGLGIDYSIIKNISFGAEYSTVNHSMEDSNNADLGSVNMTYLGANVKFRF